MSETTQASGSSLDSRANAARDHRIEVALRPEEDAALRALAGTVGLGVGDYVRTLIRKEARRFGHLPQGNGPYFVARDSAEARANGGSVDARRANPRPNGGT